MVCLVEDCVYFMNVMVGYDVKDLIFVEKDVDDYVVNLNGIFVKGLCIGILK